MVIIKTAERTEIIDRFTNLWIMANRPHSARLYIKEWTKTPMDENENDILYFSPTCNDNGEIMRLMKELNCSICDEPELDNLYCPISIQS